MPKMVRVVARKSTTTMRRGRTIQATSMALLPYTWGGSRVSSPGRPRKRTRAWTSRYVTTAKMTAQIASMSHERSRIIEAGVETGANMVGMGNSVPLMPSGPCHPGRRDGGERG
jgi:hypothetical protein